MAEKTSLQKSHSAWSNTKLTMICFFAILFVSAFWISLALKNYFPSTGLFYGCLVGTGCLTILSLVLFRGFKR